MATPADQRLLELLDKWLVSLELHAKYASLDDDAYARIQPWPEHQRPSRWIIDLARQKALALQAAIRARIEDGDASFSESLELMTFLANLVGSEHIERFIPLADPAHERGGDAATATREMPKLDAATATREMPKFAAAAARPRPEAGTPQVARTERKGEPAPRKEATAKAAAAKPAPPRETPVKEVPVKEASARPAADRRGPSEAAREQVIADAVRLVQWGRKWYEVAEAIAKMADRPHLTDVRRILKDNKALIDRRAGRG